ncbi:MAG: hypothetical protein HQ523_00510 [Lentisphaerae bacterium]|nr:hypothetical protein [Lentisphaerota bacterium]
MFDDNGLLLALQRGIPLDRRPFAALGATCGLSEAEVLTRLQSLFDDKIARRFGAVFDVRRLGYRSALCAVDVPPSELAARAEAMLPYTGITHCYERGWPSELPPGTPGFGGGAKVPSLWFTLARLEDLFDRELAEIEAIMAPYRVLVLPAIRRFKIDVVFDPMSRDRAEMRPQKEPEPRQGDGTESDLSFGDFSPRDKALVRALQGNLPLNVAPFDEIARVAGCDPDALLTLLRHWSDRGVLRRVGVILHHRTVGFKANAMCVWKVDPDQALSAGHVLASFPQVTHCYQRPRDPAFDYDLYAMIHTATWPTTIKLFEELSQAAELKSGRLLCSIHEFKKTSPRYFCEDEKDT